MINETYNRFVLIVTYVPEAPEEEELADDVLTSAGKTFTSTGEEIKLRLEFTSLFENPIIQNIDLKITPLEPGNEVEKVEIYFNNGDGIPVTLVNIFLPPSTQSCPFFSELLSPSFFVLLS